jgi:hypothetical protein
MLFKNGQLREKYRSLSPNSLRILAWQEDQYERPLRTARHQNKRKMADRAATDNSGSNSSRERRSRSPRKRAKPSRDESDGDSASDEDAEALDPTLTQDAFSAAISPSSQSIPNLRNTAPVQQISPSLSRSSRTSPTRQSQSTTYSRTPSPSKGGQRQKRIALEFTTPKFYSGLPERPTQDTVDELDEMEGSIPSHPRVHFEIPEHIATLVRDLSETAATPGCIPSDLESAIHAASHGTEAIPADAFGPNKIYSTIDSARLLRTAQEIHSAALKAYKTHRDEQAWYPLVRQILTSPAPSSFLEVDEAQTRSLCAELLPLAGPAPGIPIAGVKTDHVLQLDREHERVARVLDPVFEREPGLSLSAFNDPVAAKTGTVAVVEVKSAGGDFDEGVYQLTVVSAAVLGRMRALEVEAGLGLGVEGGGNDAGMGEGRGRD